MTTVDIREQILQLRYDECNADCVFPCEIAAKRNNEAADTMEKLLAVYEAARWFSIHTPVKHIPGLMQQTKYEMLKDALADFDQTRQDQKPCFNCDGRGYLVQINGIHRDCHKCDNTGYAPVEPRQDHESEPDGDWAEVTLRVAPDGFCTVIRGDRKPGEGDMPYVGYERLKQRFKPMEPIKIQHCNEWCPEPTAFEMAESRTKSETSGVKEAAEAVCKSRAEPKLESLHEKGEIVSGFEMITDEPKQDQEMPYTVACRCGKLWINLDADERYCRSCGFDLIGDPVESGQKRSENDDVQ